MTDAQLERAVHRGSPAFWAIALALDAVARRPGGFEVGSADAALWFDWDVIHAWLVEHAKNMTYVSRSRCPSRTPPATSAARSASTRSARRRSARRRRASSARCS